MPKLALFGTVEAAVGASGVGAAGPTLVGASDFGQEVHMCAGMMLRYDLTGELGGS